jgi:transposase
VGQSRSGFDALDAWLDQQPEPVTLVTMVSSGHYWMPLASHLRRHDVSVAVVNPLAAKYFAKSRLARTKSDPADARSLAEMAMRDTPAARDPLSGVELRQAARFAMTLVAEQAKVCQRLVRLVELGFPELAELFDDPTCRTAREVLRIAPTARAATRRRTASLANANAHGPSAARPVAGRAPPGRRGRLDRRPGARCRGRLRGRPPARSVRPARAPDRGRRSARREPSGRRDGKAAPDDPGCRTVDRGDAHRRDR